MADLGIEPAAIRPDMNELAVDLSELAALSQAISLKRIADILTWGVKIGDVIAR